MTCSQWISWIVLWIGISQIVSSCKSLAVAQGEKEWVYLSHAQLPGLQQQLHQEIQAPVDVGRMQVLKIQRSGQSQPLYLIDTRITSEPGQSHLNPLCGRAGCLVIGFIPEGKNYREVLGLFLRPDEVLDKPLVTASSEQQHGLPCLTFHQQQLGTNKTEFAQWCYTGQQYQPVSSGVTQP